MPVKKNSNSVLITGATGYIGSHLAGRLVNEGREVHVIIRPKSKLSGLEKILDKLKLHYHDGTTEKIVEIVNEANPATVYHLASEVISNHKSDDIIPIITANILFGTQLLEALALNKVPYLINTSTYWQHYNKKNYSPVCLYAATKEAFEKVIQYYSETTGLKVITLKLFDIYGPNDPRSKIFTLLNNAYKQQVSLAMSPGEQLLDLVHIDDVVDAYLIAAERVKNIASATRHKSYLVSSGNPVSLKNIVNLYENEVDKKLMIEWGKLQYHPRQIMYPWAKGKLLPGWEPKINFQEGIKQLVSESI